MKKLLLISAIFISAVVDAQVNTAPIYVGLGEYTTFFIDSSKRLTAIGNRGFTGVGGNGSGAGESGIPEPVVVSPADLKFKLAAGSFHGGSAIDTAGYVWTMGQASGWEDGTGNGYSPFAQRISVDANGSTFNNVVSIVPVTQNSNENTSQNGWLALKADGTIWIWGTVGAMRGNGTEFIDTAYKRPLQIIMPSAVRQITGGDYILALLTDGTVYSWGHTTSSNLGYPVAGNEYQLPHQIPGLSAIDQIAGGKGFNYAIKSDGTTLYGWGDAGNYMGDATYPTGTGASIPVPRLLTSEIINNLPAPIAKIVTGFASTMALLTDGSVYTWGDNTQGNIGNGQEYYGTPATGYGWDGNVHILVKTPYHLAPTKKFAKLFPGNTLVHYSYVLDTEGKLYAWGTNKSSVIANRISGAASGTIGGFYPNAWDVRWPTPVDPFSISSVFYSTSPGCLLQPNGYPCSNYPIPDNTRPVTNAGDNQSVTDTLAFLDGTASTDNVHISYYEWSQVSGPNTAVIDLPASPTPMISNLITGNYVFKLKTTDNGWFSDSAGVTISVGGAVPSNQSPVVDAGSDKSIIIPLSSVSITGDAYDIDGRIITYSWTQVSGPSTGTIVSAASRITDIQDLVFGTYVFRLTATDNLGATGTDDVTIHVFANHPPVAVAGSPQSISLPLNIVSLNGSGSDIDGNPITFSWSQVSGGSATITNPTSASTTVTGLVQGTYKFRLTVTDDSTATGTDDVVVMVNGPDVVSDIYPLPMVGLAEYGTLFIDTVGHLTAIGNRALIGTGGSGNTGVPQDVVTSPGLGFKYAAGGFHFSAAIDDAGFVWTMGDVGGGIAGNGNPLPPVNGFAQKIFTDINGAVFDKVALLVPVTQNSNEGTAAVGWLALKKDGTLWIWGTVGAMRGDGSESNAPIYRPTQVITPEPIKQVTGGDYVIALSTTGHVYSWGPTDSWNLGYIFSNSNDYRTIHQLTTQDNTPLSGITQIAGGKGFNYALKNDGTLYGWGISGDNLGDLTNPNGGWAPYQYPVLLPNITNALPSPISKIKTGFQTSVAILQDGTMWTWGNNTQGNIGNGQEKLANSEPPYHTWVPGTALWVKLPYHVAPTKLFTDVFTGNTLVFHKYAVGTDKKMYAWGVNKGAVIANRINPVQNGGIIQANYPNAWDVKWPTPVDPFNISSDFVSTSPICISNSSAGGCATYLPPANTRPVANAGPTQIITTNTTSLNGSASTDNVFIAYYEWTQVSGPNTAIIDLPASKTPVVSGLVNGIYVFKLKVIDNAWLSDSALVTVNFGGGNIPPSSHAGADQTITLPVNSVTLSGSGTDPDGTIVSYLWSKITGPSQYNIVSPAQAQTVINNLVQGIYQFELKVTDNQGAEGRDTVAITVLSSAPPLNQPPESHAGSDQAITLPTNTVTLSGTGTDTDGTIVSYLWSKVAGPSQFTIVSPTQPQTVINNLVQGIYQFELMVTDNQGATGRDTIVVTVLSAGAPPNQPPVSHAGLDQNITLPTNAVITNGSGTDADGIIVSYLWSKVAGPAQFTIVSPTQPQTVINNLVQGVYQFELMVTDNLGATGKDTIIISVNAAPPTANRPPVSNAGADKTITFPVNSVTQTGSGTDADGTIVAYLWSKVSGPAQFTIVSPTQAQTIINNLVLGVYQFELKVTDNQGAVARDTVTITVKDLVRASITTVFPNPANSLININIDAAVDSNKTNIAIYTAGGELIYQEGIMRSQQITVKQVDVSRNAPGLYLIRIEFGQGIYRTLKYVKQ